MAPPIIDRFLNWVAPVQGIDIENVSDAKRNSLVRARAESAGFKFDDDTQRVEFPADPGGDVAEGDLPGRIEMARPGW
jgi:hypothetical protein